MTTSREVGVVLAKQKGPMRREIVGLCRLLAFGSLTTLSVISLLSPHRAKQSLSLGIHERLEASDVCNMVGGMTGGDNSDNTIASNGNHLLTGGSLTREGLKSSRQDVCRDTTSSYSLRSRDVSLSRTLFFRGGHGSFGGDIVYNPKSRKYEMRPATEWPLGIDDDDEEEERKRELERKKQEENLRVVGERDDDRHGERDSSKRHDDGNDKGQEEHANYEDNYDNDQDVRRQIEKIIPRIGNIPEIKRIAMPPTWTRKDLERLAGKGIEKEPKSGAEKELQSGSEREGADGDIARRRTAANVSESSSNEKAIPNRREKEDKRFGDWVEIPLHDSGTNATRNATVDISPVAQFRTWKKRAEKGDPKAMLQLGIRYLSGEGVEEDSSAAVQWITEAAENGELRAAQLMGDWYLNGTGPLPPQMESAVYWLSKAGDLGSASALYSVAVIYSKGADRIKPDTSKAASYLARAANLGHAVATFDYASISLLGQGVPKNPRLALELFETAADPGQVTNGAYNAALMYVRGIEDTPRDYFKAVKWLRWAAERSHPQAACELGVMYANGKGVDLNETEALKWFNRAAQLGESQGMTNMGIYYALGKGGVKQSDDQAFKWFSKAALKGNTIAQFHVANMKRIGKGCSRDVVMAVEYMRMAAQKSVDAEYHLAMWTLKGIGMKNNTKEGIKLLESAAQGHSSDASYELGKVFSDGFYCEECWIKAYGYLYRAIDLGHPHAKDELARLSARDRQREKELGEFHHEEELVNDFDYSKFDGIDEDDRDLSNLWGA